jgi:flagellar motility protein MotE (MotC chaperone)
MDFLKDIQWGNVFTVITLFTTALIAASDISKRRAENIAKKAEAKVSDVTADTQMMSQIKQASIDLLEQLRKENAETQKDISDLKQSIRELKTKLLCYEKLLKQFNIDYSECGGTSSGPLNKEETK